MTEEDLTKEYLSNFPTILQNALMNNDKVKRKFLKTAVNEYDDIKVYRAIYSPNNIVDEDFCSYVEIAKKNGDECREDKLELYSVSVNTDKQQLITRMGLPSEERHLLGIASGMMKSKYGPADFPENKTHHNWYLYQGAPTLLKNEFDIEIIEDFE